jgi:hypothetical protein
MSLILLVFGILITGAGVVAIAFGVPAGDSALGQTWIMTGAMAAVGGPMLIGFGAIITQLNAIVDALRARPAAQIPRLTNARQPPEVQRRPEAVEAGPRPPDLRPPESRPPESRPAEPAPGAVIDVSGSALERLRSSMARPDRVVTNGEDVPLSPNGHGHHAEPKPVQKSEPEGRPGGATEPRLDFLFRPKAPRPPHAEPFDAMWPKRRAPADQPKPDEVARQAPPSSPAGEPRAPEREARSVAILKSGVVDGMAYTLYADGSIEAQLPHGTVRFGSIAELRAHIENNS